MISIQRALHPDPATLTTGQRKNKKFPTPQEVLTLLRTLNSDEYKNTRQNEIANDATYYAAFNAGLIAYAGSVWGGGYEYRRNALTCKGLQYLRWLERPVALAVIEPKPRALIPYGYDARFDTVAHWMEDQLWMEWMLDRAVNESMQIMF